MSRTFGTLFRVTTFGESHGSAIGCIVDGCPARIPLATRDIQPQLDRRRPGSSALTTPRSETDTVSILSGLERGLTLGRDISVVSHDDALTYLPNPGNPPVFTATRSPVRKAGEVAIDVLLSLIDNPGLGPIQTVLEADLVPGQSSGPAPAISDSSGRKNAVPT